MSLFPHRNIDGYPYFIRIAFKLYMNHATTTTSHHVLSLTEENDCDKPDSFIGKEHVLVKLNWHLFIGVFSIVSTVKFLVTITPIGGKWTRVITPLL
jgi:hypothetical protein